MDDADTVALAPRGDRLPDVADGERLRGPLAGDVEETADVDTAARGDNEPFTAAAAAAGDEDDEDDIARAEPVDLSGADAAMGESADPFSGILLPADSLR